MLNWLVRYAPALAALERHGDQGAILDVGCGPHGLACLRPDQPFVGLDVDFGAGPVAKSMVAVRAEPGTLPFADGAFDTVLCLDVLEHVPDGERSGLVAELARVSAHRVLLACPTSVAQDLDDALLRRYRNPDGSPPAWLAEHFETGLPSPARVEELMIGVPGFRSEPVPMPNAHLSALVVLGDLDADVSAAAATEYRERAADWAELLRQACFGPSLRSAWLLTRDEPRPAAVPVDDLRAAVAAMVAGTDATLVT